MVWCWLVTPFHLYAIDQVDEIQLFQHLKALSSERMAGRKVNTLGSEQAQQYIISQLKRYGIQPFGKNYRQPFSFYHQSVKQKANNIIGLIPSKISSGEYIVLSAHYDHLGVKNGKTFLGADDNASGVSALLVLGKELVRIKPKFNIILLFTDAEELGLHGAKHFVSSFPCDLSNIVININLDMLSGSSTLKRLFYIDKNVNKLLSKEEYKEFKNRFKKEPLSIHRSFKRSRNILNKHINWLKASDHRVFYQQNIPVIYFGVGLHKHYHSVEDSYENANLELFLKATNVIFKQILYLNDYIRTTKS